MYFFFKYLKGCISIGVYVMIVKPLRVRSKPLVTAITMR
jgi:hypothetical protein